MEGDVQPHSITNSPEQLHLSSNVDWVSLLSSSSYSSFNLNNHHNLLAQSANEPVVAENEGEKVGGSRNKRPFGRPKKAITQRIAFHTRSVDDILDNGFRWRKYGQKAVKNSSYPRSYCRCTYHTCTCNVKKQIQRLDKDSGIVETTYEGLHNHPCEKLMELLTPLLRQMRFLQGN